MWRAALLIDTLATRRRQTLLLLASRRRSTSASSSSEPPPPPPQHQHHHHVVRVGAADGGGDEEEPGARRGDGPRTQDPFIGGYTPVTKALWRSRLSWDAAAANNNTAPPTSSPSSAPRPPPPRSVVVTLPLSRDGELRDTYANPWGRVRLGRLLEDLDSLSGTAAFAHVASAVAAAAAAAGGGAAPPSSSSPAASSPSSAPPRPPLQLVTASVDAIHLARPLRLDRDLRMCGRVVWSGSSSLDVRMEVTQRHDDEDEDGEPPGGVEGAAPSPSPPPSLVALFSYVALDRATRRPVRVPAFVPATEDERRWFDERQVVADARRRRRQQQKQQQQQQQQGPAPAPPPPMEEGEDDGIRQRLMARLSAAAARLADLPALSPPRLLPLALTRVDNALITQPQHRNTAGRVFGGFLMRRAFELSFAAAFLFAGSRPAFVRCDDVSFSQPVDVGDLMRFSARVLAAWPEREKGQEEEARGATPPSASSSSSPSPSSSPSSSSSSSPLNHPDNDNHLVAVEVVAERARPERREVSTTNTFRYVYRVGGAAPLRVPIPTTAEDAQRVAALVDELSREELSAVSAALDAAERG